MFGFGKRNKPARSKGDTAGASAAGSGGGVIDNQLPWKDGASEIACNLALGSLAGSLAGLLTVQGRVHAETYVAAAGGIAGYFAQLTLVAEQPNVQFHVVKSKSGEEFLFGDPLNNMLMARTQEEGPSRVWSVAAGAAIGAGLPVPRLPDFHAMFRHVAGCIGGPQEGLPSTGSGHQPGMPVRPLLKLLVPKVRQILSGDISEVHSRFGPAPPKWWCAITAQATARPITDVKDVLDPAIALTILMESAIYGSKLIRL